MLKYEEINRLHIELSSMCNAACPSCPRNVDGGYTVPWLNTETMTFNDFVTIFPPEFMKNINFILFCGNYGDPILCKDLPEIAEYISSVNPKTWMRVHTNGGVRSTEWWKRFATVSDHIEVVFSIDGLEDTNHIYRRGVVWEKLIENVKSFISNGGNAIWEYLIFQHNEHQIDSAKDLSEQIGFKKFRLKRPMGFEFYTTGYNSMRVIDKEGKFSHFIFEASDDNYKNTVLSSDNTRVIQNNHDMPPDSYKKLLDASIEKSSIEDFSFLDGTHISCMAVENKEIYVDASGGIHPCCFLGHSSNNASSGPEAVNYFKWFNERFSSEFINAKKKSIKDILESSYFQQIADTWDKTHRDGRILTCTKMCAKNKNIKDNLWVDQE
jgi:MoaA/NifB/PqqE/SkfB family radical SAM enzyme